MARIIKFFGLFFTIIIAIFVILGHITMIMIYDFNYLLDTLWPADPEASSSIWYTLAAFGPGVGLWAAGYALEKFGTDYTEKPVPKMHEIKDNTENGETSA